LSTPRLYITDFGLARIESDATAGLTMTGDLLGTLRYMSPEQAEGRLAILDHRTDIYSLGITLYELLTLRPAFPAADRQVLLRQIAMDEPPTPRKLNPAIPADLETVLLKSIAKDPRDRYVSAHHMADDLRLFLAHQPIMARPPSLASRTAKWMNRHRSFVASAVNDGGLAPRDECRQSNARSPSRRGECSLRAWKGECLSRASGRRRGYPRRPPTPPDVLIVSGGFRCCCSSKYLGTSSSNL
jgi:serine/threonine protein kinase